MNEGKLVEVEITDLAFDGKSVGHIDGKVVFCDGGLPGERVQVLITRNKPRYYQAKVHSITEACSARKKAFCSHFDYCGGCAWQDLDYDQQLVFKHRQVVACLERIGNLKEIPVRDVIASSETRYYRNKMEFSFHALENEEFSLGLHRRGKWDEVFDLDECFLESKQSNQIVDIVRSFVKEYKVSVYDVNNHTGFMRFLAIREGKMTEQILVNIVTNLGDLPEQQQLIQVLTENVPEVKTIVHNQTSSKANVATGEVETILYGSGDIEEEILGKRFKIRANSFFQTNSVQAEKLYQVAFDLARAGSEDSVLDLYCGTGTIGILIAESVGEVIGVELVADAIQAAKENAKLNKIDNIDFLCGHVKEMLKSEQLSSKEFDLIIIDPPRAGLHPKALKQLLKINAPKILYISCNPATFSRDAAEMVDAGYSIDEVHPVDMFPHTKHIELVGLFQR